MDIAVNELVVANGQEPTKRTMYPIYWGPVFDIDTPAGDIAGLVADFDSDRRGSFLASTAGLSDDVIAAMREIGAHHAGYGTSSWNGMILGQLHELSLADKHQALLPLVQEGEWFPVPPPGTGPDDSYVAMSIFPMMDGAECYRRPDAPPPEFFHARPRILFGQRVPALSGLSVPHWTKDSLKSVREVAEQLSAFR
ncbi:MAG: hypothetical protein GKS06_15880 [Acidobacteria bacterium]|nr:hypothetical protein [Acidobacteriota bacterium]